MVHRFQAIPMALWARTTRRMRLAGGLALFLSVHLLYQKKAAADILHTLSSLLHTRQFTNKLIHSLFSTWLSVQILPMPSVSLDYNSMQPQASSVPVYLSPSGDSLPYNPTKVALLIENRPDQLLAPVTLHFMSVVPPDWSFRFMGSVESVTLLNRSAAIRDQVSLGKLTLMYIPSNMSTGSQEEISRFLTTRWLYETVLAPAETLLIFQTDSMLCANSRHTLDEYADYDWCGAPWDLSGQYGGNGGLSIRSVSAMLDVLREQTRADGSEPEDVWLSMRLGVRPGANMANGSVSSTFSGETNGGELVHVSETGSGRYSNALEAARNGEYVSVIDGWRDGFYEPMGYHTGGSGETLHGVNWGTPEKREHNMKYCPEMKMVQKMDVARYVPGNCKSRW